MRFWAGLLEFLVPYLISGAAASWVGGWEDKFSSNKLVCLLIPWLFENVAFYGSAAICRRLARLVPGFRKVADTEAKGKEPFWELLVVEGLDTLVRLGLMWSVPLILGDRRLGLLWGSYMGDGIFALILHKKRRLVELITRPVRGLHKHYFKLQTRRKRRYRSVFSTF